MNEKRLEEVLTGAKAIVKAKYGLTDEALAQKLHVSVARVRRTEFADWKCGEMLALLRLARIALIPQFIE